jgi:rhamnose utilization protein RhaD (predicted bifunctional aldolase and dehydrogenase)/NAD(P)-dependent dehydrogenase (short-subunit alcohol dehydrogenase family)
MQNRWRNYDAATHHSDLDLRAYTSRLMGQDPALVLHGGGNTSVKSSHTDRFGAAHDIIWVKASGYDLGQMWTDGFTALKLDQLVKLSKLDTLSDTDMVNEVKCARLNAEAAAASIEAIVHAVVPFKFVDHSHANAILTLSNSGHGRKLFTEIFGDSVLVLPYVKPGFDLAVQFRDALEQGQFDKYDAIILEQHGVFTFADTAKASYDRMIAVVDQAEQFLIDRYGPIENGPDVGQDPEFVAKSRKSVSKAAGRAVLSLSASSFPPGDIDTLSEMSCHGTLTPEHVIHNKPFPAVFRDDPEAALSDFVARYTAYFQSENDDSLTMLAPYPHWALFESGHARSFGPNFRRASISRDVVNATLDALRTAQKIGGWQGLSPEDLFALEYWELEQSKLKRQGHDPVLSGKIAVVSGAATGIGRACAEILHEKGAVVVGLDVNPEITTFMNKPNFASSVLDLTDDALVKDSLAEVVQRYGGLDILVSNAGIFKTGDTVETMPDEVWDSTLAVNLTSHRKLVKHAIPYLRQGIDPSIIFVGSRNVQAPGAGASAYSVSKAGLTQLMRVLALELASEGIKVNAIHPDAVFDTRLWTQETLKKSADRYGLTIAEYKTRNLLKSEITSRDVGFAVAALADGTLSKTTGAQIPVDGGNDRVI